MFLPCLIAVATAGLVSGGPAPSRIPPVTVRWEDPTQEDTVVVEGARYRCRISTLPARVLSLAVDGKELLGPGGIRLAVIDAQGRRLTPAPVDVTPEWSVWRGQSWQPATSARARMNVWNASPYYYDAHILDIPLMAEDDVARYQAPAPAPIAEIDCTRDNGGCEPLHSVTMERAPDGAMRLQLTGEDPYVGLPNVLVQGPVRLTIRLRCPGGGAGAIYWAHEGEPGITGSHVVTFPVAADNAWHDYQVTLSDKGRVNALRFDPPGETGTVDVASIRIARVPAASERPEPVRGELVFHAQPDRLGIELRADTAPGRPAVRSAMFEIDGVPRHAAGAYGRVLAELGAGRASAVILGAPGSKLATSGIAAPLTGARPGTWLAVRPGAGSKAADRMAADLHPLADAAARASEGHWLGYDPASGIYTAEQDRNAGAFAFDPSFHNPTRRMVLGLDVANDAVPRDMLIKVATGTGNLEAGVLTDRHGFMLPIPAFVAKNFAGEMEEPDDTAYGDVYFPLRLAAGERRSFDVEPLTHGWGIWPLKQVSSIRFFLIYWHCSTGASESTCWAMNWLAAKGSIFEIPDFRPMSGPFTPDQPQHDCQHWPGWLQYNDAKGRLCYERTVFDSIAPSLARFTMLYHTSDHAANARVEAWEAPQRDEMRTMVRLRYDWVKPCAIDGDARRNFRWLNMNHFRGRNETLLWTGPDGSTRSRPVPAKDDFVMLGEPLAAEAPFMASEGGRYNVLTLVRSFRARLGGKDYDRPVLSAAFDARDASTWLTVPEEKLALQPGDFLEAEVMLMPHGEPSPPGFKAERERRRFGLSPVRIEVKRGVKVADYPPQVRADGDAAAFHLEGGHGDVPLLIDGMRGWKVPMLWVNGVWQDHQVHGGDGYQVQPDGAGGYRVTFIAPHRDGQRFDFVVTRAECTGDIAGIRDRNGYVEMRAARPGTWSLKAPAAFGPGRNRLDAGDPLIAFRGSGASVRQLPLGIDAGGRPVDVTVEAWTPGRIAMKTSGAAKLAVGGLKRGAAYRVAVAGKVARRVALDGTVTVSVPGAASVIVTQAP